jgi:hypothetical protein
MSFPFGGVRRREDRELTAGNRRFRQHLARDINDQRTLASDAEPPVRRGNHWFWFVGAVVAITVLALLPHGGRDVPLTADCAHPRIAVSSSQVDAGTPLRYRLAGADHTRFVVTLEGARVRGDAGSLVQYSDTPAGPALELPQCLSPTLEIAAPAGNGVHELALQRLADDGTTTQVEAVAVTVVHGR